MDEDDDLLRRVAERQRVAFFLCIVPPGGGDQDFGVDVVDAHRVPVVGEYVRLMREGEAGGGYFRVLQVATDYRQAHPEDEDTFIAAKISVTAEYVEGPFSYMSKQHFEAIEAYKKQGRTVQREPGRGY